MSGGYAAANDVDVDLRSLFGSLARKWPRIVFVALLVTGAAFAFAWLATPHYKAETKLEIGPRESVFTRPNAGVDADSTGVCPMEAHAAATSAHATHRTGR